MKVVAEGIEEDAEWYKMQAIGCDYLQGYLFSRSVQVESMPDLMSKQKYIKSFKE